MVGVEFKSVEEAESFYHIYSKIVGFSVRKNESRKKKSGTVTTISWCCSSEGFRKKKYLDHLNRVHEPKMNNRIGCQAMFRIHYKLFEESLAIDLTYKKNRCQICH